MNERTDATGWFHYARHIQKNQLRQLAELGVLAGKISHLTHMLQCERGASNIWLCSRGRLYGLECRASSALADEQLAAMLPLLAGLRPLTSSALCHRIATAVAGLEQLPALRGQIKAQSVTAVQMGQCPGLLFSPMHWNGCFTRQGPPQSAQLRHALLAGKAATEVPAPGRTICSCYNVGENAIRAAIADGCGCTATLGKRLRCGTNCGSCLPELKALLTETAN